MLREIRSSGPASKQTDFTALPFSHRFVIAPLVHYILGLSEIHCDPCIVVVATEFVEVRRYGYFFTTSVAG